MTMTVREAQAAVMLLPNTKQLDDVRAMLDAMVVEYQEKMIDAKPDQLPVLQAYCRQCRQIRMALTDHTKHSPTV